MISRSGLRPPGLRLPGLRPPVRASVALAALLVLGMGASGCAGLRNPLPFLHKAKNTSKIGPGERIPVLSLNQSLEPAAALKGVDFAIPAPVARTDWPLPGGTPEQSVEHTDAAPSFQIAWRRKFGVASSRRAHVTATPIVADGRMYVMDGQASVFALDPGTGREIWRRNLAPAERRSRDKEAFGGGLAYADGSLFVTSGYRFMAALDAATGSEKWRTASEAPIHGAPTVSGGRAFAISVTDELKAYDTATGAVAWTYQAIEEPARVLAASSPAMTGDIIVAPFASGEITALNPANGTDIWNDVLSLTNRNNALSEIRDIAGRPVIYRGDVLAGSHAGLFAAVDIRTGQRRWSLPTTTVTTPLPAGDVVYVVSQAGEVICIARDSGQVYWVVDLNAGLKKKQRTIYGSPILASNRLIVVSERGDAIALDPKTGARTKTLRLGSPAFVSPIAVNGTVYVMTDNAELVAIR